MPTCWHCLIGATHTHDNTITSPTDLPPHLSPGRDIHVIISILSGSHSAQSYFDETLKPALDKAAITPKVHTTTSRHTITELCRTIFVPFALKGVKQTILLLSGDGGVVDIVNTFSNELMRDTYDSRIGSIFTRPVLVLFPQGTANALAWSAGVASEPQEVMIKGRAKLLPSFEARFSQGSKLVTEEGRGREEVPMNYDGDAAVMYGAVVASWGLHASLVAMSDTAEYRRHGVERFKMAAGKLLEEAHVYRGRVKVRREGRREWEGLEYPQPATANEEGAAAAKQAGSTTDHAYILCTLVSNLEEHFKISPTNKPLEGKMRLVAIRPDGPQEIMRLLGLAYQQGKHVDEENVVYQDLEALRIEFLESDEQWRQICIDGKIIAVPKDGWFEVRLLPGTGMDGRRVVEVVC